MQWMLWDREQQQGVRGQCKCVPFLLYASYLRTEAKLFEFFQRTLEIAWDLLFLKPYEKRRNLSFDVVPGSWLMVPFVKSILGQMLDHVLQQDTSHWNVCCFSHCRCLPPVAILQGPQTTSASVAFCVLYLHVTYLPTPGTKIKLCILGYFRLPKLKFPWVPCFL